jgi:hypothetical protein
MSFRTDDERMLLTAYTDWLVRELWLDLMVDEATRRSIVTDFLKDRQKKREEEYRSVWPKGIIKPR